ncbi:MAG: AAA domain-containing protein [Bacteroidota bacterium]
MTQQPSITELFAQFANTLRSEEALLAKARTELTLFGGVFLGSFAHHHYYRFEIPEDVYLRGVENAQFIFSHLQPVTIEGRFINLENQFLTVALPMEFGPILPEIKCRWSHGESLQPVFTALSSPPQDHPVADMLFRPEEGLNALPEPGEPVFLPTTSAEQKEAIQRVLNNRVSFLWGPILSGKTQVLALLAAHYVRAGKKILFVANTNDRVDETLLRTIDVCTQLGFDQKREMTRVGLPLQFESKILGSYSLEYEVDTQKGEKKKGFEEQVSLLQAYWRTKVHQYLYEDFYVKLSELRERANENKRKLDKMNEEIAGTKETIHRAQNASMMEKLKKGFSNEERDAAQKLLAEKQALQKKLQSMQQALTTELMRTEAQAPIESDETRAYQMAVKQIGELGGLNKVGDSIEEFAAVDELALLRSKRFVATTITTALTDPRLKEFNFDVVIVDDAETVQLPVMAALALMAKERMVVAGDPYQVGPECISPSGPATELLTQDIFLHVAQTDQLNKLFDWSQQHPQWSIFLSSHFATTPKLSLFVASVLFDDRINVFASPHAKGKVYVIDTHDLRSSCRQYFGKKKIIPHNDAQTKKVIEAVKHALMEPGRSAADVGVILPFAGTTMYTKLQLRLNAIRNVEVGTPQSFRGRRKKAIIFDLVMAGADYTMRPIDDRKIGEHRIARLFNSVFSCVEEDLYVIADMAHFKGVYRDRLITKLLMLLQVQADGAAPYVTSAKRFDDLEWDDRAKILDGQREDQQGVLAAQMKSRQPSQQLDVESAMRMKMMAKQQAISQQAAARDFVRETYHAVTRVVAYRKDANLLSQSVGGDVLFRSSLATELAAARLPLDVCQSEEEFRKIMERWNQMIYEMSGAGKTDLSFFARQTPEARVRFDINNLKAYYSSDVEAVLEEGKHRVATQVTKVFQECLGKPQPANPAEWSTAYLNFLSKMESYLGWISEQLRK